MLDKRVEHCREKRIKEEERMVKERKTRPSNN